MSDLPEPVLYTCIAALCGTIVFLFRMLLASQERRTADVLVHHNSFVADVKLERAQADTDRERYISQLEVLVTKISSERIIMAEHMVTTIAANTEAIRVNTLARESAADEMEKLMKEIARAVIVQLVELGLIEIPNRVPKPASL